jgi:ubiquitin carboxyl-terminal hydrolase 7
LDGTPKTHSFNTVSIFLFFISKDIHELTRVLLDELSDYIDMNMFKGELIHKIECLNVKFTSESIENFYDIQLPIKNLKNIYESLREYTKKNLLLKDNQYSTEKYGKQV